jgi:hypothetical protein
MPALLAKQGKIVQTKPSGNVRPAVFRRNQSLGVVAKPPSPTPQAYLHWERKSDTKHEYPDGVVGAMEGNPYFNKAERFGHASFGLYLVTRLIGYTRADCLRLVDKSLAATRRAGPFLLHVGPSHNAPGFKSINDGRRHANEILTSRQMTSLLSLGDAFAGATKT